jgi:uncharacterized protein (TIGR02271 family)
VNPTEEDAYWRENYKNEPYVEKNRSYEEYQPAYQTGYEGYSKYGSQARSFDEVEPSLQQEYTQNWGQSSLGWDKARHAARAAWEKLSGNLERLIGYSVVDQNGRDVGTVANIWSDNSGQAAYLGIRTGSTGKRHFVLPAQSAQVSHPTQRIKLLVLQERLEGAPSFDPDVDFTQDMESEVARYYGIQGSTYASASSGTSTATDDRTIQLKEDQLSVGKRNVEAGGVRLRKIVRTEVVNQPVELEREEIVVERVPASGNQAANDDFDEEEIYVPLRREEAVVNKETRVREEVRIGKRRETERQTVSETLRKEDVEIDRESRDSRM